MAKKAQRPVEPFWEILPGDEELPAAERSRFKFRPMTQPERLDALDNSEVVTEDGTGTRQLRFRNFAQALETVLMTMIEAENFPAGDPVPYPKNGTRKERATYLNDVEDHVIYMLGQRVLDRSQLGEPEKKF